MLLACWGWWFARGYPFSVLAGSVGERVNLSRTHLVCDSSLYVCLSVRRIVQTSIFVNKRGGDGLEDTQRVKSGLMHTVDQCQVMFDAFEKDHLVKTVPKICLFT